MMCLHRIFFFSLYCLRYAELFLKAFKFWYELTRSCQRLQRSPMYPSPHFLQHNYTSFLNKRNWLEQNSKAHCRLYSDITIACAHFLSVFMCNSMTSYALCRIKYTSLQSWYRNVLSPRSASLRLVFMDPPILPWPNFWEPLLSSTSVMFSFHKFYRNGIMLYVNYS